MLSALAVRADLAAGNAAHNLGEGQAALFATLANAAQQWPEQATLLHEPLFIHLGLQAPTKTPLQVRLAWLGPATSTRGLAVLAVAAAVAPVGVLVDLAVLVVHGLLAATGPVAGHAICIALLPINVGAARQCNELRRGIQHVGVGWL